MTTLRRDRVQSSSASTGPDSDPFWYGLGCGVRFGTTYGDGLGGGVELESISYNFQRNAQSKMLVLAPNAIFRTDDSFEALQHVLP